MDSDDETFSLENTESPGEEEEEQEDNDLDIEDACGTPEPSRLTSKRCVVDDDDFRYEVITADEIVDHMAECIREVNTVVQVPNNN